MARYDESNAECLVFSYRDGLLAKLAHDLKIGVERFSIEVDDETQAIVASFDPTSLRVVSALQEGTAAPGILSKSNTQKIHDNIDKDVLRVKRYPTIEFASSQVVQDGEGFRVRGTLTLHGTSQTIQADVAPEGDHWFTEVPLYQPNFGIKPFTAAFGALKIKPTVNVQIRVPREGAVD